MTMTQTMQATEQRILTACASNQLYAYRARGIQGPHTLSYALRLHDPTAGNLRKAGGLGPAIEAAIGDGPVRVYSERGLLWVEVPSPAPCNWPGKSLEGRGLAVPLGVGARRNIVGNDFEQSPHLLIVAPTGAGKTTAMRTIAFHLARQNERIRFILLTLKPADWRAFNALAATAAIISEPGEVAVMLGWLVRALHQRAARNQAEPRVFLFADDLLNWLSLADMTQPLAELASLGRSAGIHLVVATQRLGKRGAGDAAITGNMSARLVLGAATAQDAVQFSGRSESGAHLLGRYKGDALLVENDRVQRLAVSSIADSDLAELPQQPGEQRPWLRAVAPTQPAQPPQPVTTGGVVQVVQPAQPATLSRKERAQKVTDAQILEAYRRLKSKNKVAAELFGYKDGWVLERINAALKGGQP
jgi:hypothetical protein